MLIDRAEEHEIQESNHFDRIAAQLRAHVPAPRVRDELMKDLGLSKLAAGKLVEDVQKGVRMAKINLVSGGGVWLFGATLLFLGNDGLLVWLLLLSGTVQLAAGLRTMRAYRNAVYEID